MKQAPHLSDEAARLQALYAYDILDTGAEAGFDDIVELAGTIFRAPIALISLVDTSRQWFKARIGVDICETGRDVSFCGHAIADTGVFVVADTFRDFRFVDNPLVVGPPFLRFYAGAPLVARGGHQLGTLCIADTVPRELNDDQLKVLQLLARQVVDLLELRRQKQLREQERVRLGVAERSQQRFLGAINHEMRSPLTAILGLSELLAGPTVDDDERVHWATRVTTRARELERRLTAALILADIDPGAQEARREPVDTGQFLDELNQELSRHARAIGLPLSVVPGPDLPARLVIDKRRTSAAAVTLALSAFDQCPRHGLRIAAGVDQSGGHLRFTVGPVSERMLTFVQAAPTRDSGVLEIPLGLTAAAAVAGVVGGSIESSRGADAAQLVLSIPLPGFDYAFAPVLVATHSADTKALLMRQLASIGRPAMAIEPEQLAEGMPRQPSVFIVDAELAHSWMAAIRAADSRHRVLVLATESSADCEGADQVLVAPLRRDALENGLRRLR